MKIQLNAKAHRRLEQGHPWIFRSDISVPSKTEAGIAELLSPVGKFLGKALYSPHSEIALRFLTSKDETIDESFWEKRIRQALQLRQDLELDSNAYRVVFGESDGIPSFVLDCYDRAYAFQILSAGLESQREALLQSIHKIFNPQLIVERNDVSVRKLEQLPLVSQILFGESSSRVMIQEGELKFEVDLLEGQKTGAFLDQRSNRLKAAHYSKNKKRILDVCAYQGWFSCQMGLGGAEVIALDQSTAACESVKKNAVLNRLNNIQVMEANAFDALKVMDQNKEKFDLINLDPPAFVKSRKQIKNALRGYKEINLRGMKMLNEGGILITSSCSHHLSEENFLDLLQDAAIDARKKVQILERSYQAPDHPALLGFPESNYLKCFFLKVYSN